MSDALDELTAMQRYLGEETIEHGRDGIISRRDMMIRLVDICGSAMAVGAACRVRRRFRRLDLVGIECDGGPGAATTAAAPATTAASSPAAPATTAIARPHHGTAAVGR